MCMSKGIPKKPEYGPCRERHGGLSISPTSGWTIYNGGTNAAASTGSFTWTNTTTAGSTGNWTISF